eukprot:g5380.t1
MRKKSLDELRILAAIDAQRQQLQEEERLQKIIKEWTARRDEAEDADYYRNWLEVAPHRQAISRSYINYDREYGTRELSPKLLWMIAECLDFTTPEIREQNYSRRGLINSGFGVEGKAPIYGCWPDAKKLTAKEKKAILEAETDVSRAIAQIDLLAKLGQKWNYETQEWRKVRPIANERLRNQVTSPIQERMELPGTPNLVDMVLYAASPTLSDTITQGKDEITASVTENRKQKGGEKMTRRDTSRLPKSIPKYDGPSYLPCFGKLDLYQAHLQLAVKDPSRNYFQVYNPSTKKFEFGRLDALSFGNVHSVFGFVGAISELINHIVNDLLRIPAVVYIDDIIFCCTEPLGKIYMKAIRQMLALLGIAVEPQKCEVAPLGTAIELLGIEFITFPDRVEVRLTEKKVQDVAEKVREAWKHLNRFQYAPKQVQEDHISDLFHLLEELNGLFIHCTYWRNVKKGVPLTRHIYHLITSYGKFKNMMKSIKVIKMLKILTKKMCEHVELREPMVIRLDVAVKGRIHVMTDASMDKNGRVALGGLLFSPDGKSEGFSLHIDQKHTPMPLRRHPIMVYELVAVYMAQIIYKDQLQHHSVVMHCDNSPACYGIVKGILANATGTAVVASITNFNMHSDTLNFYAYINTDANPSDACTRVEMLEVLGKAYGTTFPHKEDYIKDVLQRLTFNNLNSYRQQFRPCRAVPPDVDRVSSLNPREQAIFIMWAGTGLRKDSFASIRPELSSIVMPERKFVKCQVPSVKSIPNPGQPFFCYIPEPVFQPGVFPVEEYDRDQIANKLGTTSHGVRRALAIYLRRRAAELGLLPKINGEPSKAYRNFMKKVNDAFAWTSGSYMWTEVYAQDAIHYISAKFMIHQFVDDFFANNN